MLIFADKLQKDMENTLRFIKTKTEFGMNIDVMHNTLYVGNIRVHKGQIICNPVVNHFINKEIILYEFGWTSGARLPKDEYFAHLEICKDRIREFIKSNKRSN